MSDYTPEEIDEAVGGYWSAIADGYHAPYTLTLRAAFELVLLMESGFARQVRGEEIYAVIKVGTQFFKKTGHYMSHDGDYWDGDCTEVHEVARLTKYYE